MASNPNGNVTDSSHPQEGLNSSITNGEADRSQLDIDEVKSAVKELADRIGEGEIDPGDELTIDAAIKRMATRFKVRRGAIRSELGRWLDQLVGARSTGGSHDDELAEPDAAEIEAARQAAWEECKDLATDPKLMHRLLDTVSRMGVAGDRAGVLCVYLVAVSRLLDTPCRMLRRGSASSGKNYVIDKVIQLLNADDYLIMTGGSAKSIFYTPKDLRHRLLIIQEAAALAPTSGGSEELAMVVREFISSGRLIYHTVQPIGKNGKMVGVELPKEGPVAFLMTTARPNVEEELLTRLLVTVTDESDEQTRRVLEKQADHAAGHDGAPVTSDEIAKWRSFQTWLRLGPRAVVVPFARSIAGHTTRRAIRIRRDFPQILGLTQACALLHRAQRRVDPQGRIIVEFYDYEVAVQSLGEGLEELAHGETTTIEAVRVQVAVELRRGRWMWARETLERSTVKRI